MIDGRSRLLAAAFDRRFPFPPPPSLSPRMNAQARASALLLVGLLPRLPSGPAVARWWWARGRGVVEGWAEEEGEWDAGLAWAGWREERR